MSKNPPTGERLDRAKLLLQEALQKDPGAATQWLHSEVTDDPPLLNYVLDLMSSARSTINIFGDVEHAASDYVESLRPDMIGRYRVLDTLGEGGMGTVYLAEQTEPLRREVAIKLVKLGMDSRAIVLRFEHERQSLAMMEHDGIAKVHDCGTSERGQPYFVMELVRGTALATYCDERRVDLRGRIALLQQVCDAVQHAHQKGVVHRDLKPSNVLVVETDGKPQIKVIDFGLAKAMGDNAAGMSLLTQVGQVVGTPEYMAPEQAEAGNVDIDTRADVYSLGVMLYELLVGSLPFADTKLRGIKAGEMQRVMREFEPPRASRRLQALTGEDRDAVLRARSTPGSVLMRALHSDLDWVAARAMAKARADRYESPSALAADLQRFLSHEPLHAGPPSASYRLRKFVRRYRAQVFAVSAVVVTAVVGAVVAGLFAVEAYDLADQKGKLAIAEAGAKADANKNAELLAGKVQEFDLLAGVVQYEAAVLVERGLYPAWPTNIERLEAWLTDDAAPLIAMREEVTGVLRELRARALPRTDALRESDLQTHPRWQELLKLESWVEAARRASRVRAGEELTVPDVPKRAESFADRALWRMALARMSTGREQRSVIGQERLGLAFAQLAAERSAGTPREAEALDLLAWAYFVCGDDVLALASSELAITKSTAAGTARSKSRLVELKKAFLVASAELVQWEDELRQLRTAVHEVRTYEFEQESQRFLHDALVQLKLDITSLEADQMQRVNERLAWAHRLAELAGDHPNARVTWQQARDAVAKADGVVASKLYAVHPVDLQPEHCVGLVPIGMNPQTKLWEFYHLATAGPRGTDPADAAIPEHAPDGSIAVGVDTGIVFVLIPGGSFVMGAQSSDPAGPSYEADGKWYVHPPHSVRLDPYLLARHELTQAQWARTQHGDDAQLWPSKYKVGAYISAADERITATHPANQIDWTAATATMQRFGLALPTEAQWEYACRAGTDSPWFCKLEDIQHYSNLSDAKAGRAGAQWNGYEKWDDGYVLTAPVDGFLPHPWGFHHITGNLMEWCRDDFLAYEWPVVGGDGLREGPGSIEHMARGGSTNDRAVFAKSSMRTPFAKTTRFANLGIRPARSLKPKLPE